MIYKKKLAVNKLKNVKLDLPINLRKYLTKKQSLLLKCIIADISLRDMMLVTNYSRNSLFVELMQLGRTLATYDMIENNCFPKNISNEYLKGWNDLKTEIRKNAKGVINEKKYWCR